MKKATKPATTTTPATPAPAPVKKSPAKPAAKAAKPAVPKPPVAAPAAPLAPVVKTEKAVAPTLIVANLDVGFGNSLYVRGDGPGLSWDKGVPLDCIADDKWSITLKGVTKPVVFKFLVNDLTWSVGDDFIVTPGSSTTFTPAF